jgi:hypothetical protein
MFQALHDRDIWTPSATSVPERPSERSHILHVLPNFAEALEERVWFGGLGHGIGRIQPANDGGEKRRRRRSAPAAVAVRSQ